MSRDRRETLYERARAMPPEARAPFLDEACRNDPGLREELASLLQHAEPAEAFFSDLAGSLANRAMGHRVGHYRLLGVLGSGGMGTVYRARDLRLERDVALKFLPAHLGPQAEARDRLLVEARAAAALEHPNVCSIHEIGETSEGRPFIAMACYEGETLKERLGRGPVPPAEAVAVAVQVARGLGAAHARGIVHRDVKPGNIMLSADGTVRLLDFGLAKLSDVTVTGPGVTPGTIAYMSPEQARGHRVDHRTDLWSLGVVLYEMLTGARPFRGDSDRAVLQAILHATPKPLVARGSDMPAWLGSVVERLLEKDPERRYRSIDQLIHDLTSSSAAGDAPVRPRHPVRRAVTGVAAVVLLAVTLLYARRTMDDGRQLAASADDRDAAPAIAVLPFSVRGEGLELWREGMVDLLSIGLDGAGGLRALDSRTLLTRWNEDIGSGNVADLERALGVARRAGARYVLVGSVVAAGPRVRMAADVHDLASGRSIGQAVVEGSPDSVLALADALGMQSLALVLGKDRSELPALDLAGVTTSSLVALKAYLEGEVRLRQGELAGAVAAWERAIRADTTFALSYLGLAEAYGWDETKNWARGQEMLDRAYALADRLPPREATVVRTRWALRNGESEGLATVEEAVRRYPDEAELWYALGESYYHTAAAMRAPEEIERAFRRAVELEPGSALYRAHLLDLAFQWRPDSARVAQEVEAYGRLAPASARARGSRVAFALGFGKAGSRVGDLAALDTLDAEAAGQAYMFLSHPRFVAEREAVFPAVDPRIDPDGRATMALVRFRDLALMDGRVREALEIADRPWAWGVVRYCGPLQLSLLGVPTPAQLLAARLALTRGDSSALSDPSWVTCAAAYAADHGRWNDHAVLLARARAVAGRELAAGDSVRARAWNRAASAAEAHGLWRRGRKEEALRLFQTVLSGDAQSWLALWHVGQLAFELGRMDLAERAFRSLWHSGGALASLYLARIYEWTERPAEARAAYEFFAHAWRNSDPELQPMVSEARQAVARLSGSEQ